MAARTRVTLTGSGPYSYNYSGSLETPSHVHGEYSRRGKHWHRTLKKEVYLDGTLEKAIAALTDAAKDLDGAIVSVEDHQEPYDDSSYAKVFVYGEQPATPDELDWIKKQIIFDNERQIKATADRRATLIKQLAELDGK